MGNKRPEAERTRDRLLEAACSVFACKGYYAATVAEICESAAANIAAVNYYFRSKENLYVEAWRHAFQQSIKRHPVGNGVPDDAQPDERLRGHVLCMLGRISDPRCHQFEIMHKEMANPTGLLDEAIRESIEPIRRYVRAIVRDVLGERAAQEDVELCAMSIRNLCFGPMLKERRHRAARAGRGRPLPRLNLSTEVLADHIARFSMAGMRAIRRHLEDEASTASRKGS